MHVLVKVVGRAAGTRVSNADGVNDSELTPLAMKLVPLQL
jgi:hypothetical protein